MCSSSGPDQILKKLSLALLLRFTLFKSVQPTVAPSFSCWETFLRPSSSTEEPSSAPQPLQRIRYIVLCIAMTYFKISVNFFWFPSLSLLTFDAERAEYFLALRSALARLKAQGICWRSTTVHASSDLTGNVCLPFSSFLSHYSTPTFRTTREQQLVCVTFFDFYEIIQETLTVAVTRRESFDLCLCY